MRRLSDLKINQEGIIEDIKDSNLKQKLLEMGCIPGERVKIMRRAPFKGPIAILISSYMLSLRTEDAQKISIKSINTTLENA